MVEVATDLIIAGSGANGAVRIIWGAGREFPSSSENLDQSKCKADRVSLPTGTSDLSSPAAGDIYYNTDTNKIRLYDGSYWSNI